MRLQFNALSAILGLSTSLVVLSACSTTNWGSSSDDAQEGEVTEARAPLPARDPSVGAKLMIIGNIDGELVGSNSRDAILTDRLIADVHGAQHLHVLVVPGASASPAFLGGYLRSVLALRGVSAAQVDVAHIANEDDDTTPAVDESLWANGAYSPTEVAKVARANVIWFAGGDQNRLTSLLLTGRGRDTPFLDALRAKLKAADLILVGYSAGAAVFSDPMIGNGTSFGAISLAPSTDPECAESDPLCVSPGLGFIPASNDVVVDQHFDLRLALADHDPQREVYRPRALNWRRGMRVPRGSNRSRIPVQELHLMPRGVGGGDGARIVELLHLGGSQPELGCHEVLPQLLLGPRSDDDVCDRGATEPPKPTRPVGTR